MSHALVGGLRPLAAAALVLAGAVGPAALLTPAAHGDPVSCRGLPATIVGSPDADLAGTPGPDVVVTAGALRVQTGDGDDVVCTTDSLGNANRGVVVETGPGADVVDTSAEQRGTLAFVVPGPGADLVSGGAAVDQVTDDDVDPDTIATGAGRDKVDLGVAASDLATVDLGAGNDEAYLHHPLAAASTIAGGPGSDQLIGPGSRNGHWVFDNRTSDAGEARRNGVPALHWSGMEVFVPDVLDVRGTVAFFGSAADETFYADTVQLEGARMGGGDDQVSVGTDEVARSAVLAGGPGHDLVSVLPDQVQDVTVDLARHELAYVRPSGSRRTSGLTGFEDAFAQADVVGLVGDRRDNTLQYVACSASVRAGAGDDRVLFPSWAPATCEEAGARGHLTGGPGDDVLVGSAYRDTIVGGPGLDEARGRGGRDACSAEVRRSCEVTVP